MKFSGLIVNDKREAKGLKIEIVDAKTREDVMRQCSNRDTTYYRPLTGEGTIIRISNNAVIWYQGKRCWAQGLPPSIIGSRIEGTVRLKRWSFISTKDYNKGEVVRGCTLYVDYCRIGVA